MKKRASAIFMITILIIAIFSISLIQPVKAQSKACCESTKTGAKCVYTDINDFKPVRLAGSGELLGNYVKNKKSYFGNVFVIVRLPNKTTRAIAVENISYSAL